jgi:hypothetical protein
MEINSIASAYSQIHGPGQSKAPRGGPSDKPVEAIEGRPHRASFSNSLEKANFGAPPGGAASEAFDPLDLNKDGSVDESELADAGLASPFGSTSNFLELLSASNE